MERKPVAADAFFWIVQFDFHAGGNWLVIILHSYHSRIDAPKQQFHTTIAQTFRIMK